MRNTNLESLFPRLIRRLINDNIIFRPGEMFMLKRIKRALPHPHPHQPKPNPKKHPNQKDTHPFTINHHLLLPLPPPHPSPHLRNLPYPPHIRRIIPRPKNRRDPRARVHIVGRDKRPRRIVYISAVRRTGRSFARACGWKKRRGEERRDARIS
jgi:hypothetical protein